MKVYCEKHVNQNGLKELVPITPIDKTLFPEKGRIFRKYCPRCKTYLYLDEADHEIMLQDVYYEQIQEQNKKEVVKEQ
jgi:hypothetical protein